LAGGNFGPALLKQLLNNQNIWALCDQHVTPFYRQKMQHAVSCFTQQLAGLDFAIHKPEGAIFLWLWFKNLPVSSEVLYQRLKLRGVLVVSGHHFFAGLKDEWAHRHECIRVTYCQDSDSVAQGAKIISEEVRAIYREKQLNQ
jgi:valine--pyruvate aminotransferase